MEEQKQITREEVLVQLKEAIELQHLQTHLQELRTKLVMHRYDEIRYMQAFKDMTEKPEGPGNLKEGDKIDPNYEGTATSQKA